MFRNSRVFRIGGDEFVAILTGDNYKNRNALVRVFRKQVNDFNHSSSNMWKRASVALGIAVYNPETDTSVEDVISRADKMMYDDKKKRN